MTTIDTIRESSRLALLTPGEAVAAGQYEEHLEAVKAAPAMLTALLALHDEQASLARFAKHRADDWFAIAIRQRERIDGLTHASWSSQSLRAQNQHVKELYQRERRKRQALALRNDLDSAEYFTTAQAIERWHARQGAAL